MNEFIKNISLANLPAETAGYLDQIAVWARLAREIEDGIDGEGPDELDELLHMNMGAAQVRCMIMLDHLNERAVLESLAYLIRLAQQGADE